MLDKSASEARQIQTRIYSEMSPQQKWQEVLRLRATAMMMKRAFILQQNPGMDADTLDAEVKKVFLYAST